MSDLVERARERLWADDIIGELADRIEKLVAALARIAKYDTQAIAIKYDTQAIAMDALRPGERIREKKDD